MHDFINYLLSFGVFYIVLWLATGFIWSLLALVYMKLQMQYEENRAVRVGELFYCLTIGALGGLAWIGLTTLFITVSELSKLSIFKKKLF